MSDYRDLDWEMFTGYMFSKKELDEIYQQGRVDAEEDAENRMQRILDSEKELSYQQGRVDERERIVAILKENSYEVDIDCPPYQETVVSLTDILEVLAESEIVRGGE